MAPECYRSSGKRSIFVKFTYLQVKCQKRLISGAWVVFLRFLEVSQYGAGNDITESGPIPYHDCKGIQQIVRKLLAEKKVRRLTLLIVLCQPPSIPAWFPEALQRIIQGCLRISPKSRWDAKMVGSFIEALPSGVSAHSRADRVSYQQPGTAVDPRFIHSSSSKTKAWRERSPRLDMGWRCITPGGYSVDGKNTWGHPGCPFPMHLTYPRISCISTRKNRQHSDTSTLPCQRTIFRLRIKREIFVILQNRLGIMGKLKVVEHWLACYLRSLPRTWHAGRLFCR
eukprot:284816327_5